MIRKLLLGLSILTLIAAPMPAWARGEPSHAVHAQPAARSSEFHGNQFRGRPDFHGRPEFHGHARFVGPSVGFYFPAPYVAGPFCGWQPGYWAQQTYVDEYGNSSVAPRWVPPQYVCS
jgi:hypothetical protein